MAPEAELGPSCDYTEKVDIFSLGVLIIHTLTHQLPVPGPTRTKVNGKMVAFGEFERREAHLKECSDDEKRMFREPIKSCLEFDPDDRIAPAALVQHFQTIQELVGEPAIGQFLQQDPQNKSGDDLRQVQEMLRQAELKVKLHGQLQEELQVKLHDAEVKARKMQKELAEVKEERCLREEKEMTLENKIKDLQQKIEAPVEVIEDRDAAVKQQGAGGQLLAFRQIEWDKECNTCTGYSVCMASSNAVHLGEEAYVGMSYNNQIPSIHKIIRVPQGVPKYHQVLMPLPWPVERFALAAFKGALLVVGGKFKSGAKPGDVGEYSNKISTLRPEGGAAEFTLPSMMSGCTSPAVVTTETMIIVVHGEGSNSGVEVLDTTSASPKWKEVEPLPYCSATPSAAIANGYLAVWIGAVYCMHLSAIMKDRKNAHHLPSNWLALPSPPECISLQLTSHEDRLAAFLIAKDNKVLCYHFDQVYKEWILCCEIAMASTVLTL